MSNKKNGRIIRGTISVDLRLEIVFLATLFINNMKPDKEHNIAFPRLLLDQVGFDFF